MRFLLHDFDEGIRFHVCPPDFGFLNTNNNPAACSRCENEYEPVRALTDITQAYYNSQLINFKTLTFIVLMDETFLDDREDVDILRLDASCGVDDEDAHVAVLDGANATQHRVVLDVLIHLVLLAYTGGVDEIEVEAKLVVSRVDAVAGGASDVGHDVALLVHE